MRILLLGDVGVLGDMVHIGDEAMFEQFVAQLRLRGVTSITGMSSNPEETAARYGIDAVPNVGFAPGVVGGRAEQEARMQRVLAAAAGMVGEGAVAGAAGAATGAASAAAAAGPGADDALAGPAVATAPAESGRPAGLDADDPARRVIDAVRSADGVAVSGGGNMASIWPMHIFERATLAGLAAIFGKPFVVSGQTIGPELRGADRDLVAALLGSAALVGLREKASLALVQDLGVTGPGVEGTIDDASFLGFDAASAPDNALADATADPARPYCAVTLAAHVGDLDRDDFAAGMASLLDRVAESTGLEIVFFAHFASLRGADDERGDSLAHRRVIDRMTTPSRIEPTTDSLAAARFARGASLAVTSRYHPAIFAVSAGVPTVGIAVDDYTTVKLTGALGNFGQSGVVTAADVLSGGAAIRVLDTYAEAEAVRAAWSARVAPTRATSDAWWDRVARTLGVVAR